MRRSAKIRVLIADDHAMVRMGLASLLGTEPDIEVVGEAEDGADAVKKAVSVRPDVVVMDLVMPKKDGVAATTELREKLPTAKCLILTSFGTAEELQAVRAPRAQTASSRTICFFFIGSSCI